MIGEFHDIPGYEGLYQFNWHTNEVRRLYKNGKTRIITNDSSCGKLGVHLYKNNTNLPISLGRIALLITQGPKPEGMVCCHNDGNKYNNFPDNVRYDTQKENMLDVIRHGKRIFRGRKGRKVLRSDGAIFNTLREAGIHLGRDTYSPSAITGACQSGGKIYGYGWQYLD